MNSKQVFIINHLSLLWGGEARIFKVWVVRRVGRFKNSLFHIIIDNGVKLGWLVEPAAKTVEIYRPHQQVEIFNNPQTLSGEDILSGFVLDLGEIF